MTTRLRNRDNAVIVRLKWSLWSKESFYYDFETDDGDDDDGDDVDDDDGHRFVSELLMDWSRNLLN